MTTTPTEPFTESRPQEYFYPIKNCEWISLSNRLSPIELKILIYLRTIDPFGDDYFEIRTDQIAAEFAVERRTVSRALRSLAASGDIEIEFESVKVKVIFFTQGLIKRSRGGSKDPGVDQTIQGWIKRSRGGSKDPDFENSEPNPSLISETEPARLCTNGSEKLCSNKTIGTASAAPVENPAREADGTDDLKALIRAAGVNPNKTIERSLKRLQSGNGSAARRVVENAISALQEQSKAAPILNPGGFLNAAILRQFTSHEGKRSARRAAAPPAPPPPPPPPDLTQLSHAIDLALRRGDREFARGRLAELFDRGGWNFLSELLTVRKDWRFKLTIQGVEDRL